MEIVYYDYMFLVPLLREKDQEIHNQLNHISVDKFLYDTTRPKVVAAKTLRFSSRLVQVRNARKSFTPPTQS